jgi:hypothetical protein
MVNTKITVSDSIYQLHNVTSQINSNINTGNQNDSDSV